MVKFEHRPVGGKRQLTVDGKDILSESSKDVGTIEFYLGTRMTTCTIVITKDKRKYDYDLTIDGIAFDRSRDLVH